MKPVSKYILNSYIWKDDKKRCSKCKELKEYSCFNKCASASGGLYAQCKECRYGFKEYVRLKTCITCNKEFDIKTFPRYPSGKLINKCSGCYEPYMKIEYKYDKLTKAEKLEKHSKAIQEYFGIAK